MNEKAPQPQQNPLELIKQGKVLVPEILTHPGREEDLAEYKRGWADQSRSPSEQIIPQREMGSVRNAGDWYSVGAAKRYQHFDDYKADGTRADDHEKDLFSVMNAMRANPDLIPYDAWPTDDNDEKPDSSPGRFS